MKPIEPSKRDRQEEKDAEAIRAIGAACPLVQVEGGYSRGEWRIRGLRKGEVVIDVRGQYLKGTQSRFHDAYALAVSRGLIKKEIPPLFEP